MKQIIICCLVLCFYYLGIDGMNDEYDKDGYNSAPETSHYKINASIIKEKRQNTLPRRRQLSLDQDDELKLDQDQEYVSQPTLVFSTYSKKKQTKYTEKHFTKFVELILERRNDQRTRYQGLTYLTSLPQVRSSLSQETTIALKEFLIHYYQNKVNEYMASAENDKDYAQNKQSDTETFQLLQQATKKSNHAFRYLKKEALEAEVDIITLEQFQELHRLQKKIQDSLEKNSLYQHEQESKRIKREARKKELLAQRNLELAQITEDNIHRIREDATKKRHKSYFDNLRRFIKQKRKNLDASNAANEEDKLRNRSNTGILTEGLIAHEERHKHELEEQAFILQQEAKNDRDQVTYNRDLKKSKDKIRVTSHNVPGETISFPSPIIGRRQGMPEKEKATRQNN